MSAVASSTMVPAAATIVRRTQETEDSFTWELEPPTGSFPFWPGQFNMVYLFGVGEVAISISGPSHEPEHLVHTIRGVGRVTKRLAKLREGDTVGIRGPFGKGWPLDALAGRDLIFVAGGIGLAPLRPAIYEALHRRKDFGRVAVVVGARSPADIIYDKELLSWMIRSDIEVDVTVDRADRKWKGQTGVVTKLIDVMELDGARTSALMCGPEIMMKFAAASLARLGVAHNDMHVTLERNMQCAVARCGHCQLGSELICRDGPVYTYDQVERLLTIKQL